MYANKNTPATTTTGEMPQLADMQVGQGGLMVQNAQQMWEMAGIISKSAFKPKGLNTHEDIFLGIQFGYGVGLSDPLQIVQNIAVVNGRPSFYGDMLLGICKASPHFKDHFEEIEEVRGANGEPDLICRCYAHREGESKPHEGKFSFREAVRAGLTGKDTYKGYPRDMIMWKARARAFRAAFPDVLKGVSFREDLDEPRTRTTVDAEVTESTPKKGLGAVVARAKAADAAPKAQETPEVDSYDEMFDAMGEDAGTDEQEAPEPPQEAEVVEPEGEPEPENTIQAELAEDFQSACRKKGMRVPAMIGLLKELGYTGKIGDAPVDVLEAAIEKVVSG